jgi:hypothetical protein
MAYTEKIDNNSEDSHQTSPAYVLTVTRWSNRDSLNYKFDSKRTRGPLVIVSDAISIQVKTSKSNPNHTLSCVLKQGDLNYLTAIHPGDYIIVNLVNSQKKAMDIRTRALQGKSVNRLNDGFKGLFKISDVRMQLATMSNGAKTYAVSVSARAFDEFNNNLYFNPAFNNAKDNQSFIINNFTNFKEVVKSKDSNNVQNLSKEIIKRCIGIGLKVVTKDLNLKDVPLFRVPKQVVDLLNKNKNKKGKNDQNDPFMSKINNYYMGIWSSSSAKSQGTAAGFNSFFKEWTKEGSNWFQTPNSLPGTRQVSFENFMNVKVWSLLKDYSNPVLNECYTCFRISKDNHVYPSLVVRQKPFNNRKYADKKVNKDIETHTQFLDLPRWKISPNLIYSLNIGRSDAARINFVQVFTRSLSVNPNLNSAIQLNAKNYIQDKNDIERHGRKPYIVNCNYDYPLSEKYKHQSRKWAVLVADWVMNGHLKMNGTIVSAGIVEPICIGDNLELDGTVYHIESVNHTMQLNEQGFMSFRTTTTISMGISDSSTSQVPVYAEMDYTDTFTRRTDDYKKEKLLPGFSDTQDLPSRVKGEEVDETIEGTFTNPSFSDKGKKKK